LHLDVRIADLLVLLVCRPGGIDHSNDPCTVDLQLLLDLLVLDSKGAGVSAGLPNNRDRARRRVMLARVQGGSRRNLKRHMSNRMLHDRALTYLLLCSTPDPAP
jgi:hypothetical protein